MKKASKKSGQGPSEESLREMPEVDFGKATVRSNPYATRVARDGIHIALPGQQDRVLHLRTGKGRPARGTEVGSTSPRSVRFPDSVWKALREAASERGLSVHAALREAVALWLGDVTGENDNHHISDKKVRSK